MSEQNTAPVWVIKDPLTAAYGFGFEHPFGPDRHDVFHAELESSGVADQVSFARARIATREELLTYHTARYVDFVKEARAAARLNHPNIVQSYAVGEEEGIYFFAMEYVEGKTLKQLITEQGKIIRTRADDIRTIGRNTQGVRLISLEGDDRVTAIAKLREEEKVVENDLEGNESEKGSEKKGRK